MLFQKRAVGTKFDIYVFITSVGELLVSDDIIHSVVSISAPILVMRYIYDRHLQFIGNLIINQN